MREYLVRNEFSDVVVILMKAMIDVFLNKYIIQGGGDSGNAASSGSANESGISTGARNIEEV